MRRVGSSQAAKGVVAHGAEHAADGQATRIESWCGAAPARRTAAGCAVESLFVSAQRVVCERIDGHGFLRDTRHSHRVLVWRGIRDSDSDDIGLDAMALTWLVRCVTSWWTCGAAVAERARRLCLLRYGAVHRVIDAAEHREGFVESSTVAAKPGCLSNPATAESTTWRRCVASRW